MNDAAFCRQLLKLTYKEVRAAIPDVMVLEAWVYHLGRDHWEFHYKEFYWHGSASNAYEARSKGWYAFLAKQEQVA